MTELQDSKIVRFQITRDTHDYCFLKHFYICIACLCIIRLRESGIYHIKKWRMDFGGCGAHIAELLRRGCFIVLFADKTGAHRTT